MKHKFNCPNCLARLRADDEFSGRRILCPKCGLELEIPQFKDEEGSNVAALSEALLAQTDSGDDSTPKDATTTFLPEDAAHGGADDFDLATDVGFLPPIKFEPPPPDPNDPMLELFPDFVPNPFAVSVTLDKETEGVVNHDEEESVVAHVNSKMPSVDELIN